MCLMRQKIIVGQQCILPHPLPPHPPPGPGCQRRCSSSQTFSRGRGHGRTCTCLPSCTALACRRCRERTLGPHLRRPSEPPAPAETVPPSPPSPSLQLPSFAVEVRGHGVKVKTFTGHISMKIYALLPLLDSPAGLADGGERGRGEREGGSQGGIFSQRETEQESSIVTFCTLCWPPYLT